MSLENESLLKFPCPFPVKIMGQMQDGFADEMLRIVRLHAPDFDGAGMELRASSGGKYLSVTCTINAVSRQQLDDLYREITAHAMVVMAL